MAGVTCIKAMLLNLSFLLHVSSGEFVVMREISKAFKPTFSVMISDSVFVCDCFVGGVVKRCSSLYIENCYKSKSQHFKDL